MAGTSLFRVGDDVEFARVLQHLTVLVLFVILFERGLHTLEHRLRRSPKYRELLSKVYRELMILGFVGLGIKAFKEVAHADATSEDFAAFNIADLTIFILALALIVQALVIFLRLRHHNGRIDRVELVNTSDLVDAAAQRHEAMKRQSRLAHCLRLFTASRANAMRLRSQSSSQEIEELRVLRHIFLRRYSLPQLFPFGKYIRRAQDSQITHMIDVEVSTWFLLIVVAWGLEGALAVVRSIQSDTESHAFVFVFLAFAWTLVAAHCAAAYYFNRCLHQLLQSAGYSASAVEKLACLRRIGRDETEAWDRELAVDALEVMQRVQEEEEARQLKLKRRRHHLVEADTGLQLLSTCFRHARSRFSTEHKRSDQRETLSESVELSPSSKADRPQQQQQHQQEKHQHPLAPIEIRWFSRKAWHFGVIFLLMLNGFYLALLCQCILYQLEAVHTEYGWAVTLLIPLPLALNTVVFQPWIFRNFMIVCSIFRVHTKSLAEVITHFREIVELRSEFAESLNACMQRSSLTVSDLERALASRDPDRTGLIEIEKLRAVLRSFGLQLSLSRFSSLAKLLFKASGRHIEYAQVIRLVLISKQEGFVVVDAEHHASIQQLILTTVGVPLAEDQAPTLTTVTAGIATSGVSQPTLSMRRPLLSRNESQLTGASSRAIQRLYHIDSLRLDATSDAQTETHYVQM